MNYCGKIHYTIQAASGEGDFRSLAGKLLSGLKDEQKILRLCFFGNPEDNHQYLQQKGILGDLLSARFSDDMPAWSYIAQPPAGGGLLLEVHSCVPDEADLISYKTYKGFPYVVWQAAEGKFLFAGGLQGDILTQDMVAQSTVVFRLLGGLLAAENIPVNRIVRQWNYLEDITGYRGEDQNYQSFNNARGDFYGRTRWHYGYPSATGIGASAGGVLIDFDAIDVSDPETVIRPIDNKLQIAAHAYSENVLAEAQQKKATPKFERAKALVFGEKEIIYVSGTAAIRGEESLRDTPVEQQFDITMENIFQLTGDARPALLRVYLKEAKDDETIRRRMEAKYPNLPVSYLCADICRDELLIEIEGIAFDK